VLGDPSKRNRGASLSRLATRGEAPADPCCRCVRARFPTRLVTRTKESNVHASQPAFMLVGVAQAKSTKDPHRSRTALLGWSPG